MLYSVNIREADKLCLIIQSSAVYNLLLIARVTAVYTKKSFSSPHETNENMFILWKRFLAVQQRNFNLISIKFKSYKRRYAGERNAASSIFLQRDRANTGKAAAMKRFEWSKTHSGTEKTRRGGTKIFIVENMIQYKKKLITTKSTLASCLT